MNNVPQSTIEEAAEIAKRHFGIQGSAKLLASERDQNFKIACADGKAFVLKIANGQESREMLEAQNGALLHLHGIGIDPTRHRCATALANGRLQQQRSART